MNNSDIIITGPSDELGRFSLAIPRRWNIIKVYSTKKTDSMPPKIKRIHIPICDIEEPDLHAKELLRKLKSTLPKIYSRIDNPLVSMCLSIFATNSTEEHYTRNITLCNKAISVLREFQCSVTICVAPEKKARPSKRKLNKR